MGNIANEHGITRRFSMAHRIEVGVGSSFEDAPGEKIRRRAESELGLHLKRVRVQDVYTVDADLSYSQLQRAAGEPLCDPIVQRSSIDHPLWADDATFDWAVEVGSRPGVTDNVGRTATEALCMALGVTFGPDERVYHSKQYLLWGGIDRAEVKRLCSGLLANDLIQQYRILDRHAYVRQGGFEPVVPRVLGEGRPEVQVIDLDLDDDGLRQLSKKRVLALSLDELHAIRDYFKQDKVTKTRMREGLGPQPTDVELEALAQTWSEHCKHKIFNARIHYLESKGPEQVVDSLFDTYVRGATSRVREEKGKRDLCLSVFVDNAGVVKFDEEWSLVFKVETHNSPSALDPYGGALTGIVGVNRDPFGTGMGARLIFNTNVFCLADPFRKAPVPLGLLHPRRVLEGVREGVEHGGNKSGIPTINGSVLFDERYLGKPLVFCGTGGLLPARVGRRPGHIKAAKPGDRIVMVGGRIGADGIHGATFSSEELHEGSPSTAVQIGDPITQKRMTDFLLRARDKGLYRAITDNGAGGLSSSVGEMAEQPGGADLDLTNAPLKYEGLAAWEILLSEAQERMTVAVPPKKMDEFMELADRFQVEATDLGAFTSSGMFRVLDQGKTVALMHMEFFHNGLPRLELPARWEPPAQKDSPPRAPVEHGQVLKEMLGRLNICSKEYWVRQYDHEVQAGTVVKPLTGVDNDGPSDASVFRPVLDSNRAVVVSHGVCPRYSDLDTYAMAQCAIDEAVRNAVAVGADPDRMVGLDNFCWCDPVLSESNPDGDFKLGQLVRANRGLYDTCVAYGVACISGKDSMKNDAIIGKERISIPPTLLYSLMGIMDDARQAVTMDFKRAGCSIYVLGDTRQELGASEYYQLTGAVGGKVPHLADPENTMMMYRALHAAMMDHLVSSCHDCSDGGLAVALAECAFAGGLGLDVDLSKVPGDIPSRDDLIMYSETPGRLVVSVDETHIEQFESVMEGFSMAAVGKVITEPLMVVRGLAGKVIIKEPLENLKQAWTKPLSF